MATLRVTRGQALAWRLGRQHLLDGAADATEVVRTLAAVSVFGSDPDLSVRRRLASPGPPGEVQRALADGRLMRTFSFRGSVQVMAPETAGAYLAVRAAGRQWARKSWVEHYRLAADDWPDLRAVVREVVADGPVPPRAVAEALTGSARFGHLAQEFAEPNHTLLKPLAWQGDIALGPDLTGPLVLQSPGAAPGWAGIPDLDEAGPRTVLEYVDAYGPTTPDHLHYWLGEGLSAGRKRLEQWWHAVQDDLVEVDVDGETRWHLAEHADELAGDDPGVDRGAPARQGRLGDGAGHQGRVGRARRSPHRHDPRRQPGARRRGRRGHVAGRGRRPRGERATVRGAVGRGRSPGLAPGQRARAQNPVRL